MEENQAVAPQEQKLSDKELNFRNLEAKFQKQLAEERSARLNAEKAAQEANRVAQEAMAAANSKGLTDDDESEPYVDHRKLEKKLTSFEKRLEEKIDKKAEEKAYRLIEQSRKEQWLSHNPDFYNTLEKHAEIFAEKAPELAETILKMPDTFERQQLVYRNIKALGLDKPESKAPSIQEKIDSNKRNLYYQPGGVNGPPYASAGDFSSSGQKSAYSKMLELKKRLGG
jgi:hypothetical protein